MSPLPFETHDMVEQDVLLRSVLQRATLINLQEHDDRSNISSPTKVSSFPSRSQRVVPASRHRLKKRIKAITASHVTQVNEMSSMAEVAMSRAPEFYSTPVAQVGCSTSMQSPPSPPRRRVSLISSEDGGVSPEDLINTINPEPITCSPETTPEARQFQYPLAPRYSSSWLLTLDPQAPRAEIIAPVSNTEQPVSTTVEADVPKPLKSLHVEVEMARSSSKGALLLNRLASMSKLAPSGSSSSSTSLARTAKKRLHKSYTSLTRQQSKTHAHSGVQGEENRPQANANWDAIPSVQSPWSSKANQPGNQTSFGSLHSIIASTELASSTCSLRRTQISRVNDDIGRSCSSSLIEGGEMKQSLSVSSFQLMKPSRSKNDTSPGVGGGCNASSSMARLNKSLGNLSLVKKAAASSDGGGSPGGGANNAAWGKIHQGQSKHPPAVGRKSSLGNLRKKQKILPAGLIIASPSPNAQWGTM